MAGSNGSLTLEGLGQILRDHIEWTGARFGEVGARLDHVAAQIDGLRGEIMIVATVVRDLAQIVARHDDGIEESRRQLEEHRLHIRQMFARMEHHDARMEQLATRMEQHDARFEAMNQEIRDIRLEIRQILETLRRPGGDGESREQ